MNTPAVSKLTKRVIVFLVWWSVPTTVLFFWFRYLPRHDWAGTALHIVLSVLIVWSAITLYRLAKTTLEGKTARLVDGLDKRTTWRLAGLTLSLIAFSYVVIAHPLVFAILPKDPKPEHVPLLIANLWEAQVSKKPGGWRGDITQIDEADLRRADLRYAYGREAFFVAADLRKARLQGADLYGADFRSANLEKARIDNANLDTADFRGACLRKVSFVGADLEDANFSGAYLGKGDLRQGELLRINFYKANLQGVNLAHGDLSGATFDAAELLCYRSDERCANLSGTNLTDASFRNADLRYASLEGANLSRAIFIGADLRHVNGLNQAQLDEACGDAATRLPHGLTIPACTEELASAHKDYPELFPNPCAQDVLGDRWPKE